MTFSYLPQERIRMASKSCCLTRQQHMAGTDLLLKTTSSIIKKKKKTLKCHPKKVVYYPSCMGGKLQDLTVFFMGRALFFIPN